MHRINTLYDLETTAKYILLQIRGTKVAIDRPKAADAVDWCGRWCKKDWGWHHRSTLIDNANIVQNLAKALYNEDIFRDVEAMVTDALSREIADHIDEEILERLGVPPKNYFWFDSRDDAMTFKLTFGGE